MSDMSVPPPPPPAAAALPPKTGPAFDFGKPFTFVFDDPRWLNKILIGGLFYLAAMLIVGVFFIFGYCAQLARNVIAGVERPLPEWEDLGGFFSEGLRLFGVMMCWILPIIVLGLAMFVPAIFFGAADNEGLQALGSGFAGCLSCLMVPLALGVTFFMPASLLFAAVEQRFGAAFEFSRIWPFIKANIGNYLLAIVVYLIARMLGGFGVILLCIGVIFTAFWAFLITTHAFAQVYRLATNPTPAR